MKKLMVVFAAALCCAAFAQGPEGGNRPEGGPRRGFGPHAGGMMPPMMDPIVRMVNNPRFAEKLGLTDDQKAKLKELRTAPGARGEEQGKMREAMKRQAQLLSADKIDEAAVMAAIEEVFELRKQAAKEQVKRIIAVKSILTPEQIKKAKDEMKKRFEEHAQRGGDKGERVRRGLGPREGKGAQCEGKAKGGKCGKAKDGCAKPDADSK
ncbi:MAG: Spy/CpxP family protein refolding chaperone [Kiritimatiellae bacterium]|nr:Spy/CpxP family protein refolding chaperone [Kiritimatiellia bacterium]